MATIGSMIVNVLANTTGFASGMAKVRGELTRTEKIVAASNVVFSKFGAALGTIGIGISTAAVIRNLNNTAQAIDDLAKTADRLGISTEALKGLEFGAGLAGVSSEELASALQVMTKQIGEAVHGAGKAKDVFKELGVDVDKLAKMTPEDQLGLFADLLRNVSDESERMRIALRVFGGSGAGLLNFLAEGREAIKGYLSEAKKLGLTFTREEALKVEAFNDAWETLAKTLGGLSQGIMIDIAPAAQAAIEALGEALEGIKLIRQAVQGGKQPGGILGVVTGAFGAVDAVVDKQQRAGENLLNRALMNMGIGMEAPAFEQNKELREPVISSTGVPQTVVSDQFNGLGNRSTWDRQWFDPRFDDANKGLEDALKVTLDRVDIGLYRKRASQFAETVVGAGTANIPNAFKALSDGLKTAEEFGKDWRNRWLVSQLFSEQGNQKIDKFFAERGKEKPVVQGGLNQAIEAGTIEAFRAMAESRIQREMLQAAKTTNQELAELNRNLTIDMTGLN